MSPEQDQAYFSEGLSEEILNALAQVEGLHVAGRTSSFAFKGHDEDLRSIGAKLGVGNVLEGSVRKAAGRVRITAQIVSVADGFHLWSKTFDRDLTDIFAVQDEIARAVVAALQVKLLPGATPAAKAKERQVSPEAYSQYLLGRQFYARYSPDGFRRAVDAFGKALAIEPNYAQAWAALAVPLLFVAERGATPAEIEAGRRRAREAAERAIALDPDIGEAYSARAHIRADYDWDWTGAQADMERAVALTPGDANVQRRYGLLLATLGRFDEAIAATRRAIDIDPLFPANWAALGNHQFATGNYARARAAWARALEIAPEYAGVEAMRGLAALLEGHPAEALAAFQREGDEGTRLAGEALARHSLGDARGSNAALDRLARQYGERMTHAVAGVYAWRGERDQAFAWLERSYARHDPELAGFAHDPFWKSLREDPRGVALIRKLNLPAR
ncbi:MAG: tetratricopeptide repeat protein, partial [Anaeromyxobacteraceae bacterium]